MPAGGKAVVPAPVPADTECLIAAVSSIGRLLMFEMDELPELAKGKGNKLINIPGKKYQGGEETHGRRGGGARGWRPAGLFRRTA